MFTRSEDEAPFRDGPLSHQTRIATGAPSTPPAVPSGDVTRSGQPSPRLPHAPPPASAVEPAHSRL